MPTTEKKKGVTIYDAAGNPMHSKASDSPYFDPDFLKGFMKLFGSRSVAEEVAQTPYVRHSWVHACCKAYTRNLAGLDPALYDKREPKELIKDHWVLDLLGAPNPFMTGEEFFETIILNLLLPTPLTMGGQCFIIPTDADGEPVSLVRGEQPSFLWPYSDFLIKPKMHNKKFMGWEWEHPSGERILLEQDNVIRIKYINRATLLAGMSPFSALRVSVTTDAKAQELADKFLENNASVGNSFKTEQALSKERVEDIKAMIREQYTGYQNAGKPMLLHSGLEIDSTAKTLVELEFLDQRKFTREEVQAVYGVGKMELKLIDDVNRATAEVEKEIFWEDTLIPMARKIWEGGLNPQWIRFVDQRNLKGKFDTNSVPALRKDREGKITRAQKLIDQGVPANTAYKSEGLDIDTEDMEWLNRPWVKGVRTDLETGETVGRPTPQPQGGAEPAQEGLKEVESHKSSMSKEEREKFWEIYIERTQAKPEKEYTRMVIKFWNEQRNAFQDQADEWAASQKKDMFTKATVKDFMIPKSPQDKKLIKRSDPIYQNAINLQTIQMETELGELVNWDPTGATAKRLKASRGKFLKGLNTTTFQTMGKVINKILKANEGASVATLTKLIKQAEKAVADARIASTALTVARTETSTISSGSRYNIMKDEGIKKHSWVSAGDELVRETHMMENGNIVKIGDQFPVTGLDYPLGSGPAEETINCRCTTVPEK